MIEYTITPLSFDLSTATLDVDILPVSGLELSVLTYEIVLDPETLTSILTLGTDTVGQKSIIRNLVISCCHSSIQYAWEVEQTLNAAQLPADLLGLIGVPGTTPITAMEAEALLAVEVTGGPLD